MAATVTQEKLDKMRAQIELLLAKAESTNHPAEAELAMAQAEKMMIKYGFDRAQFNGENKITKNMVKKHFDLLGIYHLGKLSGFGAVAYAFQSVALVQSKMKNFVRLYIIGEEGDVNDVIRILTSLDTQVEHAVKVWWKNHELRSVATKMQGYKARRDFVIAFGYGAADRVRASLAEESNGKELVLANRMEEAENHKLEVFSNLGVAKASRMQHGHAGFGSYAAGRKAGENAHLGAGALKG